VLVTYPNGTSEECSVGANLTGRSVSKVDVEVTALAYTDPVFQRWIVRDVITRLDRGGRVTIEISA